MKKCLVLTSCFFWGGGDTEGEQIQRNFDKKDLPDTQCMVYILYLHLVIFYGISRYILYIPYICHVSFQGCNPFEIKVLKGLADWLKTTHKHISTNLYLYFFMIFPKCFS